MGSDKREASTSSFRKPRDGRASKDVADWGSVNEKILVRLVGVASKKGGAVRFGYTRDGGAYAIGVYAGPNYFTDFVRPSEDVDLYLTELTASFEEYDGTNETAPEKARSGRSK